MPFFFFEKYFNHYINDLYLIIFSTLVVYINKMADKKLCVPCKKWYSDRSNLNRHVKKFHNKKRFAESEPETNHPTPKVRKFPENIKNKIDMMVLPKQLEDMEKVAMDEDRYLKYLKLKLKYLQRKINIHQLKLTMNSSVTEETKNIFDSDIEETLELITLVREIVSNRNKRMKFDKTENFRMKQDNELRKFLVKLCDTVEKANEITRSLIIEDADIRGNTA